MGYLIKVKKARQNFLCENINSLKYAKNEVHNKYTDNK